MTAKRATKRSRRKRLPPSRPPRRGKTHRRRTGMRRRSGPDVPQRSFWLGRDHRAAAVGESLIPGSRPWLPGRTKACKKPASGLLAKPRQKVGAGAADVQNIGEWGGTELKHACCAVLGWAGLAVLSLPVACGSAADRRQIRTGVPCEALRHTGSESPVRPQSSARCARTAPTAVRLWSARSSRRSCHSGRSGCLR